MFKTMLRASPLELIGEIPTPSRPPLDDVVRFGDEFDGQLIDIKLLVVESHLGILSLVFPGPGPEPDPEPGL